MMNNETMRKLDEMKLYGMARGFDAQCNDSSFVQLPFEDRFGMLVDEEATFRDDKRLKRLLSLAHLREAACVEDIKFSNSRGFERSQMASLATCSWISNKTDIIFTGATGTGKTWLACAQGNQACRHGLKVKYVRVPLVLEDLATGHIANTFQSQLRALAKWDLLILDDFGMRPLTVTARSDLFELIEARHGMRSTIVVSQLPVDKWHAHISGANAEGNSGNPTIADAFLDRLVPRALKFALKGKSLRGGEADPE